MYRLILCIVLALTACGGGGGGGASPEAGGSTAPGQVNGSISGTVTDASGAPISGVQLTLSGMSALGAVSSASGAYLFGNLAAGAYVVIPSSAGATFSPSATSVAVSGQSASASFVRTALVLPSTALISSYAATLHAQTMATFAADEQALGNLLAAQGASHSGTHYSRSRTDYLAQVQAFTNAVLAFAQLKAQTMPIDHAATVSIFSAYQAQDSDYAAAYYGGVTWGLSGSALASFVTDTKTSISSIYTLAILSVP